MKRQTKKQTNKQTAGFVTLCNQLVIWSTDFTGVLLFVVLFHSSIRLSGFIAFSSSTTRLGRDCFFFCLLLSFDLDGQRADGRGDGVAPLGKPSAGIRRIPADRVRSAPEQGSVQKKNNNNNNNNSKTIKVDAKEDADGTKTTEPERISFFFCFFYVFGRSEAAVMQCRTIPSA